MSTVGGLLGGAKAKLLGGEETQGKVGCLEKGRNVVTWSPATLGAISMHVRDPQRLVEIRRVTVGLLLGGCRLAVLH